jgi:hypothetical protein
MISFRPIDPHNGSNYFQSLPCLDAGAQPSGWLRPSIPCWGARRRHTCHLPRRHLPMAQVQVKMPGCAASARVVPVVDTVPVVDPARRGFVGRRFVISDNSDAKLSKRLNCLSHPNRNHECCRDRDKIENTVNSLEALAHHIRQCSKDYQQYKHSDHPNT